MRSLRLKLVLPLTIISFATITKCWHALPVDAPDTLFTGFPFPFVCRGWHTSLSLQIFVTEFIADLLTYFLFWLLLIFCLDRFVVRIRPYKILTIILWAFSGLILVLAFLSIANKDNIIYIKRPFKMEVMQTGLRFGWGYTDARTQSSGTGRYSNASSNMPDHLG